MKKLMVIAFTIFSITLISFINKSYSINYYDLKFIKTNEIIVVGRYEDINYNKKYYNALTSTSINKDEEDAISYAIGSEWKNIKPINKQSENNRIYSKQRIIYKQIQGKLVKSYENWSKEKEITIKIPIEIEYK